MKFVQRYLSNPAAPLPPRIIPAVERSRPPSYSPELTTLLTSIHARTTTKPLKLSALHTPPTLPERANPSSDEARFLGPFSRRREVNIRWRHHTGEVKKTFPPLELTKRHGAEGPSYIRETGAEELKLLEEVECLARSPHEGPPMPRRERQTSIRMDDVPRPVQARFDSPLPTRFLRRRYRELLSRIPILTPSSKTETGCVTAFSPLALSHTTRGGASRMGQATEDDVDWIIEAEAKRETRRKSRDEQIQ